MPTNRPITSLTLSFGLVTIPVQVFSATVPAERISFNFLRAKDGSRVRQQYVAVKDGKPVERTQMAKGYEFAKDQFVMFTPAELKELEDKTSRSIDISEFVPLDSVDPIYFSATYFLTPDKGAAKPYALLATALKNSRQCAVGRWISRGKEHLVVIRPMDMGLAMHQLHFKDELRPFKEMAIETAAVTPAELKLANQLIEHLAVKNFDPSEFKDEYKGRVSAAIRRKVEGKEVAIAQEAPENQSSNVIDLMQALKASLERAPAAGAITRTPKRASPAAARKARK